MLMDSPSVCQLLFCREGYECEAERLFRQRRRVLGGCTPRAAASQPTAARARGWSGGWHHWLLPRLLWRLRSHDGVAVAGSKGAAAAREKAATDWWWR
jgi:hypothetical protein